MKKVLRTPADGANAERSAIKAKVRRMIKKVKTAEDELEGTELHVNAQFVLDDLLDWIGKRDDLYNQRPGGLGRQRAIIKVARLTPACIEKLEPKQVVRFMDSLYDAIDELYAKG